MHHLSLMRNKTGQALACRLVGSVTWSGGSSNPIKEVFDMSAYKLFESVQFPNAQLLVSALAEMGYKARIGEAIPLRGGLGRTAQIVVPHEQIEGCWYDLGFVWNGTAYVMTTENWAAQKSLDETWRNRLQATYAKLGALVFCARKQAVIGRVQTLPDGTLTFSANMEVKVQ